MSFEDDLKKYLNQPTIKQQMKAHYKATGGGAADIAQVEFYAQQAIRAIVDSLPMSLKSGPRAIDYNDMTYTKPTMSDDGDYVVELKWNPTAIHRESLYDSDDGGYPDGVENIVALFSKGVNPIRHDVFGDYMWGRYWHESIRYFIPQGWSREADPFLKNAIDAYNAAHKKDGVLLMPPAGVYY